MTYQIDGKQYVALTGGVGAVNFGNAGPQNQATANPPRVMAFVLDGTPVPTAKE